MMPILKNFDVAIIKAPKEGIMGLDKNGRAIILRNNDMVSMSLLDEKFANLLYIKGMLKPAVINEDIRPENSTIYKNMKRRKEKKRDRGRINGINLESWLKVRKK